MNALTVLSNELMMSTREIAELTGKQHQHIIRDVRGMLDGLNLCSPNLDYVENTGFSEVFYQRGESIPANEGKLKEILLNQELTICLVSGYNVALRMAIIKRWKELEEKHRIAVPNFNNPAEAARAWANEYEAKVLLESKLAVTAPKADVYDAIVEKDNLYTATQISQKVGKSAIWLNKVLETLGVYSNQTKRSRVFRQWFLDDELGVMRETTTGHSQPMFTAKGEMWIISKLQTLQII